MSKTESEKVTSKKAGTGYSKNGKKLGRPRNEKKVTSARDYPADPIEAVLYPVDNARGNNHRHMPEMNGRGDIKKLHLTCLEDDESKRDVIGKVANNILVFYQWGMNPVRNDDELEQRLASFFVECARTNQIPTVEKMCLCTGWARDTIIGWRDGSTGGFSSRSSSIVKKAWNYLSSFDAEMVLENKVNPVAYIFRAKNYYGMVDKQEHVLTPNDPLGDATDAATIAAKYQQLPDDEPQRLLDDAEESKD